MMRFHLIVLHFIPEDNKFQNTLPLPLPLPLSAPHPLPIPSPPPNRVSKSTAKQDKTRQVKPSQTK